ncbi:hypothetical protein [Arcobacter sp. FWKO B]|uniref:hypothetical protein n=1 Tax=Arcobacter sp. FWKO B TaxID=2593672 RepID=UPI0018A3E20D|nr:hypothetical protein [Arcobacter sp. FWKO B]QOG11661.1 HlyD family secretion protein [Arcobacter sp. FWKO B]
MKILLSAFLLLCTVYASEYYSKLEPYNTFIVKSSVSGKVEYTNLSSEGKVIKNGTIIKIDAQLDKIELAHTKEKLQALKDMYNIEETNYNNIKDLTSKSLYEKDTQRTKVLNLKVQIADLEIKVATLEDRIANKTLKETDKYIHQIHVKVGEYVNSGTLLYTAMDFSMGKLEFFIPISTANDYQEKKIYIDGEETDLKINKIYSVADEKHISSYKCEILIPNPEEFSRLYKIEFK